jgi:hypothetical protein
MRVEELSLEHQDLLVPRFKRMQVELSEYSFVNLFLFRHLHQYQVIFNQHLYIKGKTRNDLHYLMPTASVEDLNIPDLLPCLERCDFLFPIPQSWEPFFDPALFNVEHLDEDSDYLYSLEKMSKFPGRHLSGRRNLVKQYKEKYQDHRIAPLSEEKAQADALYVLEQWHVSTLQDEHTDYSECKEAIKLASILKLDGHVYYIENKPVGLLLGQPLNDRVYVYHFAKALTAYKGIYQYIYQEYANSLENKFEFINLEQDLGSEELKHAKRSYFPDRLAAKLRISLRKKS